MAGLGEACSHIGAALFYIQAVVAFRNGQSCTEKPNAWLPAHVKNLVCKRVREVDFSSAAAKKKRLDRGESSCRAKSGQRAEVIGTEPTQQEWDNFFKDVHAAGSKPAIFSLLEEYYTTFVPVTSKCRSVILTNLYSDKEPASLAEAWAECEKIANMLVVEAEVSNLYLLP